jgi:hypothetical protein
MVTSWPKRIDKSRIIRHSLKTAKLGLSAIGERQPRTGDSRSEFLRPLRRISKDWTNTPMKISIIFAQISLFGLFCTISLIFFKPSA